MEGDVAYTTESYNCASMSSKFTRNDIVNQEIELTRHAKKSIVVIGGEFNTLGSIGLLNALIEKLKQGISVIVYIYDPKPQRKHIDKLISNGAKVFLTKERQNNHYFVVDGERLTCHYHRRYDGDFLPEGKSIPDGLMVEFENTFENAKNDTIRLPNAKSLLTISLLITVALIYIALFTLPSPLNIVVAIGCLAPLLLETKVIKI